MRTALRSSRRSWPTAPPANCEDRALVDAHRGAGARSQLHLCCRYIATDDGKLRSADVRDQLLRGEWAAQVRGAPLPQHLPERGALPAAEAPQASRGCPLLQVCSVLCPLQEGGSGSGSGSGAEPPKDRERAPAVRVIYPSPPLELNATQFALNRSGTFAALAGPSAEVRPRGASGDCAGLWQPPSGSSRARQQGPVAGGSRRGLWQSPAPCSLYKSPTHGVAAARRPANCIACPCSRPVLGPTLAITYPSLPRSSAAAPFTRIGPGIQRGGGGGPQQLPALAGGRPRHCRGGAPGPHALRVPGRAARAAGAVPHTQYM